VRLDRIVILTGAGLSAESGLGTFRDTGGLWSQFPLEEVATPEGFVRNPPACLNSIISAAESIGTQSLTPRTWRWHDSSGSMPARSSSSPRISTRCMRLPAPATLIHMHGELTRALCAACGTSTPWSEDLSIETACQACGEAAMRPDVVWFGEMPREMDRIYAALAAGDLFISVGTSGSVYPAAGFVAEAVSCGAHTVELNLEPSEGATLFAEALYGPATQVVPAYLDRLLRG
jgi:NAD-dependent deacetylase